MKTPLTVLPFRTWEAPKATTSDNGTAAIVASLICGCSTLCESSRNSKKETSSKFRGDAFQIPGRQNGGCPIRLRWESKSHFCHGVANKEYIFEVYSLYHRFRLATFSDPMVEVIRSRGSLRGTSEMIFIPVGGLWNAIFASLTSCESGKGSR